MPTEFRMPMLGEVMEQGHVVAWHKKEGEFVNKGEIIMEVETDKAIMGVESPASGTVRQVLVPQGATVLVNTLLAIIE